METANLKFKGIDWRKVARIVLLSRALDRLEVEQLTPQGKVKYQFSAGGHELPQAILGLLLNHPHDAATAYYRSRPLMLAAGMTAAEALASGMARLSSLSQGRDVGVMYNLPRRSGPTVLPTSGDVGAQYTPASGWAQAIVYRQQVLGESDWQGAVCAALGGDGSVAANGFWAALNIAAPQKLPLLFFIEDNAYGISVPSSFQYPGGNIADNLAAYGNLKIIEGQGWLPEAAAGAIVQALDWVRGGGGPCLLRMQVARLAGHTFVDNQAYKSAELRALEAERDPLPHLRAYLLGQGMSASEWTALETSAQAEVEAGLVEAEASPDPGLEQVQRHVFYSGEAPRQGGLRPEGVLPALGSDQPQPSGPRLNLLDAVRRALEVEMALNPRLVVFGEDVGAKGGVHGATLEMQKRFGEGRVFDTSLNEDGIIGRAVGMAAAGLLPAPEIQFRKYADPAHEQINDLGWLRWRSGNNFAAPMVVRIPVGYSKKTGDPWHSVTAEAIYTHTLGWRLAFPANAEDAVGLLRTALRSDDPTFFFEHRALLDTPDGRRAYPGDDYCLPFGRAARLLEGRDLTVVTWGAMVPRCLEAAQGWNGRVDLFDLRTLIPWDREAVLESVRRTGRILVVHEDTLTGGFAGEILALVSAEAFTDLDAPPQRLATPDMPIPYNIQRMHDLIPSVEKIRAAMEGLLAF